MIFWATINIATALLVSGIVVYMLSAYHERFSLIERLSMAGVASGMLLRIGPILGRDILMTVSPFDDWATTFLHTALAGAAVCILARTEKGKMWKDKP